MVSKGSWQQGLERGLCTVPATADCKQQRRTISNPFWSVQPFPASSFPASHIPATSGTAAVCTVQRQQTKYKAPTVCRSYILTTRRKGKECYQQRYNTKDAIIVEAGLILHDLLLCDFSSAWLENLHHFITVTPWVTCMDWLCWCYNYMTDVVPPSTALAFNQSDKHNSISPGAIQMKNG